MNSKAVDYAIRNSSVVILETTDPIPVCRMESPFKWERIRGVNRSVDVFGRGFERISFRRDMEVTCIISFNFTCNLTVLKDVVARLNWGDSEGTIERKRISDEGSIFIWEGTCDKGDVFYPRITAEIANSDEVHPYFFITSASFLVWDYIHADLCRPTLVGSEGRPSKVH